MNNKPFVNPFEIPTTVADLIAAHAPTVRLSPIEGLSSPETLASVAEGVLSDEEVSALVAACDAQPWQPVGLDGIADHYRDGDTIGSWRASCFDERLARALSARLLPAIGPERVMGDRTPTDHDGHRRWRAIGVNPLLRFIRYERGGLLVPHYDAPYDYGDDRRRTLVTVVLYIERTPGLSGGATRFVADPQLDLPLAARDYADWTRFAHDDEIVTSVDATPGSALLFDHRMLHDSQPLSGTGRKTIIRTDVVYERMED